MYIFTNAIAFYLLNFRVARRDGQFLLWVTEDVGNKYSKVIITIIALLFTFKVWRLIYGRLFNKRYFSARFKSNDTVFKPINIISISSFFLSSIPIIVSAVLTVRITQDFEIQVYYFGLEVILLSILAMILMFADIHKEENFFGINAGNENEEE